MAINNAGQVVGTAYSNGQQAVLYSDGHLKSLNGFGKQHSYATGINDAGQVVGYAYNNGEDGRAFIYKDDKMLDLNTLIDPSLGLTLSYAADINNHGVIVGTCSTANEGNNVFMYCGGEVENLGVLGVDVAIRAINDNRRFIGNYTFENGYRHGFTYNNGAFTDIGEVGSLETLAFGINASGQIVGLTVNNTVYAHAYLLSYGTMTDIDPYGESSFATAINDSGQIVGNFANNQPLLYDNGILRNLNTMIDPELKITLNTAYGINNSGQIIVGGYDSSLNTFAYLLTPVPEPSNFCLLLLSLFSIIVYKFRRTNRMC
jgi:probable HAF family extracellular repeat protein